MHRWSPQSFRKAGEGLGLDPDVLDNAIRNAAQVHAVNPQLPPIFSLRHLSHYVGVDYTLLRNTVGRVGHEPYITFKLKKNDRKSFRIICVPDPFLLKTQRWIMRRVLSFCSPHHASVAYAKKCNIVDAASIHCGCRWLIKMDVANFFESFSEIVAYRVFRSFGYQPLISFELARICTRLGDMTRTRAGTRWEVWSDRYSRIYAYKKSRLGHIPQGAPTSPMLTNLALRSFDHDIERIANDNELYYTRYADDMFFSTKDPSFSRKKGEVIISQVYNRMKVEGFRPNISKTRIHSPGARKIVLGLLVDGDSPRLTREFRAGIRMHLYYLHHEQLGPVAHAKNRGFDSVMGLKKHLEGLVSYAIQVEPGLGRNWSRELSMVDWGASI